MRTGKFLARLPNAAKVICNTRAVPLALQIDAHQGRVFFCPVSANRSARLSIL